MGLLMLPQWRDWVRIAGCVATSAALRKEAHWWSFARSKASTPLSRLAVLCVLGIHVPSEILGVLNRSALCAELAWAFGGLLWCL
jgi:hypothetical protein